LGEYKEQTVAEVSFRFLKDPMCVDGIYVKNTERVVALGYVFLMALLVYALLQRRVRLNLAKEKEPLVIPGNRRTFTPTGSMLLQMLEPIKVVRLVTENGIKRKLSQKQLTSNGLRLLRGPVAKPLSVRLSQ